MPNSIADIVGEESKVTRSDVSSGVLPLIRLQIGLCENMIGRLPEDSNLAEIMRLTAIPLRIVSFRMEMRRRLGESLMKELRACQKEVISCDPGPYYVDKYRRREALGVLHILRWISEEGRSGEVTNCLDVGCGYGTLALFCERVLHCDMFCIDVSDKLSTRTLASKHNFNFKVCNIETDEIPWSHKFDAVVFTEVMEHLNFNPVPTLAKIADAMTASGRLYLSTPDAREAGRIPRYFSSWTDMPQPVVGKPLIDDHIYFFTEDELRDIADRAGLRIVRLENSPGFAARHLNAILMKK